MIGAVAVGPILDVAYGYLSQPSRKRARKLLREARILRCYPYMMNLCCCFRETAFNTTYPYLMNGTDPSCFRAWLPGHGPRPTQSRPGESYQCPEGSSRNTA